MLVKTATAMVAVALLVTVGCGRKPSAPAGEAASEKMAEKLMERAIEKQQGGSADVDITKDGIKVKTSEGEMQVVTGPGAKLPATFPKDIFVYSAAKVMSVINVPDGTSVVLESKDSVSKVADAYRGKMKADGWAEAGSMDAEGQTALAFNKGGRQCHVMVVKADAGRTEITLALSQGEEAPAETPKADDAETEK